MADLIQSCPQNYSFNFEIGGCQHFIFPLSQGIVGGFLMTFVIAGFASLAGVGGGTPHLVVLMLLYNYTPKHSTILIFSCILGTTLGNVFSQMRQKINGEAVIKYEYSFVVIPLMFIGSIIGVILNKLSPSIAVCSFIMYWAAYSLKSMYQKFITSYQKQTQQNKSPNIDHSLKYVQTSFNPLENSNYQYIFTNLTCLFIVFIGMTLIKGTQKFDSVIGIKRCSVAYWIFHFITFIVIAYFALHNLKILKSWPLKPILLSDGVEQGLNNQIQQNLKIVIENSLMAGLFSGLGLGGGIFLIPMYKKVGCNPIQAAATCSFTVFSSSLLNVIQGTLLGVIQREDFLTLFTLSILGSYISSSFIPKYLQKINRVSIVEGVLIVLIVIAFVNLPFSLYTKYVRSGYNTNIIFGFGSLC